MGKRWSITCKCRRGTVETDVVEMDVVEGGEG